MIIQEPVSRKHRPTDTRLLQPRFGWLSGLAVLALAVAQLAGIPAHDPGLRSPLSQVWLATIWAGWAATVWITIQPPLNLRRLATAAALLAWHCGIMELVRQQPLARYVIMFAGFSVFQVTAAVLLRLPRWKLPSWKSPSPSQPLRGSAKPLRGSGESLPPRHGQFGILSLLVLMTVVAGVLWAARRYGNAGGEHFLNGAVVALLWLAMVAAAAIAAASIRRWGIALVGLTMLVVAASAAVMAGQELSATGAGEFAELWKIYFTIEAVFAMILYGLGICGRLDAGAKP